MVCKKDHVARPSCSTSGGQFGGGVSGRVVSGANATAEEPEASAAIIPAVALCLGVEYLPFFSVVLVVVWGFQFRKAVQILHGLPSGPIIMPGGSLLLDAAERFGESLLVLMMKSGQGKIKPADRGEQVYDE